MIRKNMSVGKKSISVGWMVPNTPSWLGGLNYFINLSFALQELSQPRTQPVILGHAPSLPAPLNLYPSASCIFPGIFSPGRLWNHFQIKHLGYSSLMGKQLRDHGVDVLLSLGARTGISSPVKTLEWIADFQHRYLPNLFTLKELKLRNIGHSMAARHAHAILVSSETARKDFCKFHPAEAEKAHVLRFVATVLPANELPSVEAISREFDIDEPYFHIPNQLWSHKNHRVVVDALRILKKKGRTPLVISTGGATDFRDPGFFDTLRDHIHRSGVDDRIRFLGIIPYSSLSALMRNAVALINPSLFEGWSTTVEEAKSAGKRILLSNIPVHMEQAPARGLYFPPQDPDALSELMNRCLAEFDPEKEEACQKTADAELPHRRMVFARAYEDIIEFVNGRN